MTEQGPHLFDPEALAVAAAELTVGDGITVRPARIGFLMGILATWTFEGKPTAKQKELLRDLARDTLERAARLAP